MGLFSPSPQDNRRKAQEEEAQAQRERQVRITKADIEEVKAICLAALESTIVEGYVVDESKILEARLTRVGLIIRGTIDAHTNSMFPKHYSLNGRAQRVMREGLHKLGYLASQDFGTDGLIVTGWDPRTYEGTQLSPERIDARILELQKIRAEVVEFQDQADTQA